jgi:hypothetical protein
VWCAWGEEESQKERDQYEDLEEGLKIILKGVLE